MQDHRRPPKPEYYDIAEKGQCRFCGKDIFKDGGRLNTRANWHKECVGVYREIYWPQETRRAVWKRDKGRCSACDRSCGRTGWEMDHIKPLIEAKGDISYWRLDNCTTLCRACHAKKTGAEATARAAARALQKQQMSGTGTRPKKGRTKPRNS